MKLYADKTPDSQYQERLQFILKNGELIKETPQGVGAITVFGGLSPMVFDLDNGLPVITCRDISKFWVKPIAEILAFIHGAQTLKELEEVGCGWWKDWATPKKCAAIEVPEGDLGPGSYGPAFHDFPMPNHQTFNQFSHVVRQIKHYPHVRTAFVSPWIPYLIGRGGWQKAVVSPCHGWVHLRVINGRLDLHMFQRSADFPVGVPANMIQYAALLLMIAQVTGYRPGRFIHSFSDAHIYENQVEAVKEMVKRKPRSLPSIGINSDIEDLFAFEPDHFTLFDYYPHPAMKIPVAI
ncbi:MAG: thymidylate synthase [bacterium]|nr:thymidylate synthase [bacterium]